MKSQPLISVGMSTYNNAATLAQALRSLLWQTYTNWELILIDDGSTDATLAVARQFSDPRLRIIAGEENRTLPVRLNQTVHLSRGTYYARMDGDDIAYPTRLENQLAYLQAHPQVDLAGTQVVVFAGDGRVLGKPVLPETHAAICKRVFLDVLPMRHPTFMGKRDWFLRHRYDEHAFKAQDQLLLVRTHRTSTFANVPEILLGYREAPLSLRKMFQTRQIMLPGLFQQALRDSKPGLAAQVVVRQTLKAMVEIVAVTTGLRYRLLGHRAGPIAAQEQHQWETIWQQMQAAAETDPQEGW